MGSSRRPRSKKQTRLAFEPVSSTPSPGSSSQARVRYRGPDGKIIHPLEYEKLDELTSSAGHKIEGSDDGDGTPHGGRRKTSSPFTTKARSAPDLKLRSSQQMGATAKSSSPAKAVQVDSDSEDITPRRNNRTKASSSALSQSRLTSGSSPAGSSSFIRRHKQQSLDTPSGKSKQRNSKPVVLDDSSSDSSLSEIESSLEPPSSKPKKASKVEISSDSGSDVSIKEITPQAARSKQSSLAAGTKRKRTRDETDSGSEEPTPAKGRRKRIHIADDLDDDGNDLPLLKSSNRKRLSSQQSKPPVLSAGGDSDSDAVVSSPRKRRMIIVEDDESEEDSNGDVVEVQGTKNALDDITHVVSEESDEDIPLTTPRRQRRQVDSDDEMAEVDHDSPPRSIRRQRQPKRQKRTAKQKQMELLRRKRAGEDIAELTPSEDEEDFEPKSALYDSDDNFEALQEFDDEESEGESATAAVVAEAKKTRRKKRKAGSEDEEANEDDIDFIVEDDDEPLGVPMAAIPLEFTHHAHKPLKAHFKDAIEWMVHNKINPAFAREDAIYTTAFRKLNDEVSGYANSKFASSAWKPAFRRALYARPLYYESELGLSDMNDLQKCQACGRSGHPAKWRIQFDGRPYYHDTLDEIERPTDSDGDELSDAASVNSKGEEIAESSVTWYLGRFCKHNAETAHSLIHWKYALNSWVVDQLRNDGWMEPDKLAAREEMRKKDRTALANQIVDGWEADKQIKTLWRDFKINLETARSDKGLYPSRRGFN